MTSPQDGKLALAKDQQQLKAAIAKADLAVIFRVLLTQFSKMELEMALIDATRK